VEAAEPRTLSKYWSDCDVNAAMDGSARRNVHLSTFRLDSEHL
jgi:hypothetical protein